MAQITGKELLRGRISEGCVMMSSALTCKQSCHISTGYYFLSASQWSCFSSTHCFFTCQVSSAYVCPLLVCMCFLGNVFPCLFAQLAWVCILQCHSVGGWFSSVNQGEIAFRLCLLFSIRGQYANSRCRPSCCVLVWCRHCTLHDSSRKAHCPATTAAPSWHKQCKKPHNLATST